MQTKRVNHDGSPMIFNFSRHFDLSEVNVYFGYICSLFPYTLEPDDAMQLSTDKINKITPDAG
jgi:hypothetical protein